jgi:hypothetical protein
LLVSNDVDLDSIVDLLVEVSFDVPKLVDLLVDITVLLLVENVVVVFLG